MKLFQQSNIPARSSSMFFNYRKLEDFINDDMSIWTIGEMDGVICTAIVCSMDKPQRLVRVNRMLVSSDGPNSKSMIREALNYCLKHLSSMDCPVDVVYVTTVSLTREQQEIVASSGFKILGVFPNGLAQDKTKLNGLSAYFFDGTLEEQRHDKFKVHPRIKAFYDLSSQECGLADLEIESQDDLYDQMSAYLLDSNAGELPELELVRAPNMVKEKFQELQNRHSQVLNFYPFYSPNCPITDPKQEIEVYIELYDEAKFAAIIGESLKTSVNPVTLFEKIQSILKSFGVAYIEIINDAADNLGNDCILQSGFSPCAYFPAFKAQGPSRRDYVVFGRSFEYLGRPDLNIESTYVKFFQEYMKSETANCFVEIPNRFGDRNNS